MQARLKELHSDWTLSDDGTAITRQFVFKGFAKAVYLSNLCVWLADEENHHPDLAFGWGYCSVTLTTHDTNALTEQDINWAKKLDSLVAYTG